jgi:hypothetical protein
MPTTETTTRRPPTADTELPRAGGSDAAPRRAAGERLADGAPLTLALADAFDPSRHTPEDVAAVLGAFGHAPPAPSVCLRATLATALAWALAQRPDVPAFLAAIILRELASVPSVVRRGPRHLRRAEALDAVEYVCWLYRLELPHTYPAPARAHHDARKARRVRRGVRRAGHFWRSHGPSRLALCSLEGFGAALGWSMRRAPKAPARAWVQGVVMGLPAEHYDRARLTRNLRGAVLGFAGVFDTVGQSPVARGFRNGRLPTDVHLRILNGIRAALGRAPLAFGGGVS